MKTAGEIIDEVVEKILATGRGVNLPDVGQGNSCMYKNSKTGTMCAVGHCLIDPEKVEADAIGSISDFYWKTFDDEGQDEDEVLGVGNSFIQLDELLKPDYRRQNWHFWSEPQQFHDTHSNWETVDGQLRLTQRGGEDLKEIKLRWAG